MFVGSRAPISVLGTGSPCRQRALRGCGELVSHGGSETCWCSICANRSFHGVAFLIVNKDRGSCTGIIQSTLHLAGRLMSQPSGNKQSPMSIKIPCGPRHLVILHLPSDNQEQFSLRSGTRLPCLHLTDQTWSARRIRSHTLKLADSSLCPILFRRCLLLTFILHLQWYLSEQRSNKR